MRVLAGVLAILSLAIAAAGVALFAHSQGSLLGLLLIAAGIPLAVAGWVALGRPVRHGDCHPAALDS